MSGNITVRELDLSSPQSIDNFVDEWDQPIAGLINNAGVQIVDATRYTLPENYEETFAVNHLYALKLTLGLLPYVGGGRVLFIGSGTHNPNNRTATRFGFRGAQFETIAKCAEGSSSEPKIDQLGIDRYATSKFLNMITTVELSRRVNAARSRFYCLDPGLMAGTGLARTAPSHLQFAWRYILPVISKFMPDSSTPDKSGQAGAWIMTTPQENLVNGGIYSYDRKLSNRVSEDVREPALGHRVLDESLGLLGLQPDALG